MRFGPGNSHILYINIKNRCAAAQKKETSAPLGSACGRPLNLKSLLLYKPYTQLGHTRFARDDDKKAILSGPCRGNGRSGLVELS